MPPSRATRSSAAATARATSGSPAAPNSCRRAILPPRRAARRAVVRVRARNPRGSSSTARAMRRRPRSSRCTLAGAMKQTEVLRRALLPAREEGWPTGDRLRWIYRGRLWMLPLTMLANVGLWLNLRDEPAARREVVDLFIVMNDSMLAIDLALTLAFMRRPGRAYKLAMVAGAVLEILTAVIWIQMSGTVTSYFIGTVIVLALLYRFLGNYWTGAVCFATGLLGLMIAYALEEAGVLPRSSAFATDLGAGVLPDAYRQTALISILTSYAISFVGGNL